MEGSTLTDFFANTRNLRQAEIDFLAKTNGVPPLALCRDADGTPSILGCAGAAFTRHFFDFEAEEPDGANKVLVFLARDRTGGFVDLVAWSPRADRIGSACGRVTLLGEHEILAPRLDAPLAIFRTPIGWLQAARRGAVIVDKRSAWRTLDGVQVLAEDIEHGGDLRKALAAPTPSIVLRNEAAQAEAA